MSQFIFPPLTASLDSEQSDGGALPSAIMVVGGYDGSLVQVIKTDADGNLQVDVLSSTGPSNYATDTLQTAGNAILTTIDADTSILSAAVSSGQMQVDIVADGAGLATSAKQDTIETTLTAIETDANTLAGAVAGTEMQVDVLTSALPSGAATSALQTTANGILTTIDADTSSLAGAIAGTEMQVDVLTSALPSGAATSALQTTANGILTTIDADTGSIAGAISGSEMQVDVVASLPAGSNNIGDVDVLSSALPSGAATSALQTSGNSLLTTIDADTSLLAGAISGSEMQVDIVASLPAGSNNIGDVDVLSLPADSKNYVWKEGLDSTIGGITDSILDTSTTNIPSGTQLTVATLANDIYEIQTVEDIGEFIGVYAGSTLKAILPLGGGSVKINLPSTTVVKLASFSGTAISSGNMAINFLG